MYTFEWKENALRNLEKLESSLVKRIVKKVEDMIEDPFSCDVKKLKGFHNYYRLRVGDYRVIFELNNSSIIILKVGHRKHIYD
jgi:mRNA interferase RelE/StbE